MSSDATGSGRDSLHIGVLGTRHVHAEGMARALATAGHQVAAVWDESAEARSAWERHGIGQLVADRDALLAAVDAVVVAGTNRERVDDVCACVEAGLPVLAEKPVAMNAEGADQLRRTPDAERLVAVALPIRYSEALRRARAAIASGAIGQPLAARGTNHGQFPGGWFGDRAEAGGGALMDHTVHVADGLCWLLNDTISHVWASAAQRMHAEIDVEDCAIVMADFSGGPFASIDASWSRPASFHTWGDVWIEIAGSEGRIIIDPMARHVDLYDDSAGRLRTIGFGDDMTAAMLESFAAWATQIASAGSHEVAFNADPQDLSDMVAPVSLAEGLHATDVVLAAYDSVASGERRAVGTAVPAAGSAATDGR